jgi:AraC-like DNA-binding protein
MDAPFAQALVILPRAPVLRRHRRLDACLAAPFGEDGAHAIVRDFASSLAANAPVLPPATLSRAIAALIELIADLNAGEAQDARSTLLHRALALIALEGADLDAPDLARRLGVSRRYLDNLFGRTGRTVSQHLWDNRLRLAADRLRRPEAASVTEIAHSVGFKDASHFTRSFKAKFGATPSEWRRVEA